MANHYYRINNTIKRLLRYMVFAAITMICLTAVPGPISASGSKSPNDLMIVVNLSVQSDRLSIEQVRSYFLLTKTSWPGGAKVVPVNSTDKQLRKAFRSRVLSMSIDEEQRFWQEQMIRSGRKAPPEFSNTLKAVFHLKGAISYTFRKDFHKNVAKVVLEIPANKIDT